MRAACLFLLVWVAAAAAAAQTVSVQTTAAPHYAGEPVEVHVVVQGFEEDPAPSVVVASPPRGKLIAAGVHPSVSTSISIVNGQMRRTKEVTFTFVYQLQVAEPGPIEIGPFAVTQGSASVTSRSLRLDLETLPSSDQMTVELDFQDTPVYVGERVPIALRFRLTGRLRENLHQYSLHVPFFALTETFQFLEPPDAAGTTKIEIQTPNGPLAVMGSAREEKRGGDTYLIVEVRRIAVPLRAGSLEIPPATLDVEEGVRFRRDLFGGRRPTQIRKWRSSDRTRRLSVKQIPADRTPESFAGAVGSGFSLAVSADRTVVKVGEPIALHFELRGDGNLETAALPRLDAEGLLPPDSFRVADGEIPGRFEDGVKRFTAMVRVMDPDVNEIPALEYSWFDPTAEQFQSATSRPIALSVGDAQMIGAADVQSAERVLESPASDLEERTARAPSRAGSLVLTGADLAIERNADLLLRDASAGSRNGWALAGLYAGSVLLLVLAQFDRRRRNVDPAIVARRRRVESGLRRIRDASNLPAPEAAAEIARAMRSLLAETPGVRCPEIDALIGECDARSYAPAADRDPAPIDAAFQQRALELAQGMMESES
ncbi:MAG: BatD family protein [Deltaproteobacteria bacterium]|nr:BatD family protein [Deltaproteobacteria bacterium]